MKIQYISDLHLDFYTNGNTPKKIKILFHRFIKPGEVLIIAGDISHYNSQTIEFLRYCSDNFNKIFIITGNHEMYNISKAQEKKYKTRYARINELKKMITFNNITFLDGTSEVYNSVKFAGCMAWYDCSYYYKLDRTYIEDAKTHWKNYSNDSNLIPGITNPLDIWEDEKPKIIKAIETKPDIMITHFCPVSEGIAMSNKYKLDKGTGYYCFDGLDLVDKYKPKYWIHGHMHDTKEFEIYDTKFLRNPVGYPNESKGFEIKEFEI